MIAADEVKEITDNFAHIIGHGGFGVVYKGRYHHVDVAVKMLNKVISKLLLLCTYNVMYVICCYRKALTA